MATPIYLFSISLDLGSDLRGGVARLLREPSAWGVAAAEHPRRMATAQAVRLAISPWGPVRHRLFHGGVRSAVEVVLLLAHRLRMLDAGLPPELWLSILSFIRRSDIPPPTPPP